MSRITYRTTTTGLYPLPDRAKDELVDLKGRQKDDLIDGSEGSDITTVYAEARDTVIDWQRDAGLDRIVEGQLRWDDMLAHPLAVHEAVDTGGLRRYYDNNNFYREMRVTGPLTPNGDVARELEVATERTGADRLQAVLPGPISLFDLATDDHYGNAEAFLDGIATYLAREIEAMPPVSTCLLVEPSLASDDLPITTEQIVDAIDRVVSSTSEAGISETIVHIQWGVPSESVYRELLSLDRVGIGFDLVTAKAESDTLLDEYGAPSTVSLGLVDGQNTRVESPNEIVESADSFLSDRDDVTTAYLTLNTEGFYLPTNRFREKIQSLAAVTRDREASA